VIGELLSTFVEVRQLVKVNSPALRSVKLILSNSSMSTAKVAILIGGPDWPTSVLCGIMKLDLTSNLISTLPILIIIVPMVLTGTFTYLASLPPKNGVIEFPWAGTMCTIFVVFSAFVQFSSMAAAAHFIKKTMQSRSLAEIPMDKEVRNADKKMEAQKAVFHEITQWELISPRMRFALRLSLATMIISLYTAQIFRKWCFEDFELTSVLQSDSDYFFLDIIKPLGIFVIVLFSFSCIALLLFLFWAKRKVHEHFRSVNIYSHDQFSVGETLHPSLGMKYSLSRLNYLSSPRYGTVESF